MGTAAARGRRRLARVDLGDRGNRRFRNRKDGAVHGSDGNRRCGCFLGLLTARGQDERDKNRRNAQCIPDGGANDPITEHETLLVSTAAFYRCVSPKYVFSHFSWNLQTTSWPRSRSRPATTVSTSNETRQPVRCWSPCPPPYSP